MNRYYEVTAKCGHVGRGKYVEMAFYVKAANAKNAAEMVRKFPRVKRDHRQAISSVVEVTATEYLEGRNQNNCNPYFRATCIQEQRATCSELEIIDGGWLKMEHRNKQPRSEKKKPLKLKDPWKYQKYYGIHEAIV